LAGIDAPEKKQAFGDKSKAALSDCAFGRDVVIFWDKTDRYQRIVGRVMVSGIDCNLRQVKLGMAWHYKKYELEQPPEERRSYAAAEVVARSARIGIWSEASPIAPWDFRSQPRKDQ
jgi:endonuclease YncB( thermonuclease family)